MLRSDACAAVILLAAGESRRMGRPKQLLPWRGTTLVRHAAETALHSQASGVVVVVGSQAAQVCAALEGLDVKIAENASFASGQASSLRVGIGALGTGYAAALVMLVDQPLVQPALLDALVERWRATGAPLVVPRHAGRRGNPVLIGRELFGELLDLRGDTGARSLFERHSTRIAWLEADESVVVDVDSPEAYAQLLAQEPG
jgi:molybdenum cofactor cytidylyltransferase